MQVMAERSPFGKREPIADPRRYRPRTLQEAKNQVLDYYRKCGWDRAAQLRWHAICGLDPKPLEEYDLAETRQIIDRMRAGNMLLYRDWD